MQVTYKILLLIGLTTLGNTTSNLSTSQESVIGIKPPLKLVQDVAWNLMVGKWYGSQPTKDGGKQEKIMERSQQGTYKTTFRFYNQEGTYKEHIEVGFWGISSSVYFTIFRGRLEGDKLTPSDPSNPYNYDAYKVIKLTKEVLEYNHFSNDAIYVNKRVSSDFNFPN